jgi:hypothetical protein
VPTKERNKTNKSTEDEIEDMYSFLSINSTYHVLTVYLKNITGPQKFNNATGEGTSDTNSTNYVSFIVKNLR